MTDERKERRRKFASEFFRESAIHEAGHLVMAWLAGFDVVFATLLGAETARASIRASSWQKDSVDEIQLNLLWAEVSLSGPMAVAIARSDDAILLSYAGAEEDLKKATSHVSRAFELSYQLFDDDADLNWEQVSRARIKATLRKHWRTVLAVANALLDSPEVLEGVAIVEVIERAEGFKK